MKHAVYLLIVLSAIIPLLSVPALAATDPAAAANEFYAVYNGQRATGGGIPDATGRLRYSSVLSPHLNKELKDAADAQARLTRKVKNAVPPVLEGDIFSSLFEGATAWKVGACQVSGDAARCTVTLTRAEAAAAGARPQKPASWNDTLVLVNTPQGWKVDDVIYDANFAFGNTGKLSEMLAMVLAQNP